MMKKLLALLLTLSLLCAPALAENLTSTVQEAFIYHAYCAALNEAGLSYETDADYHGCYLGFDAEEATALGSEIYVDAYAYPDGVCISAYTAQGVPVERVDEVIRLCNLFNVNTTLGKYYLSPTDNSICFEIFLPLDGKNLRDFDREMMGEYTMSAVGTLDYYIYYFLQVSEYGESADNVLAMWMADFE